jgi:hypothetical protein
MATVSKWDDLEDLYDDEAWFSVSKEPQSEESEEECFTAVTQNYDELEDFYYMDTQTYDEEVPQQQVQKQTTPALSSPIKKKKPRLERRAPTGFSPIKDRSAHKRIASLLDQSYVPRDWWGDKTRPVREYVAKTVFNRGCNYECDICGCVPLLVIHELVESSPFDMVNRSYYLLRDAYVVRTCNECYRTWVLKQNGFGVIVKTQLCDIYASKTMKKIDETPVYVFCEETSDEDETIGTHVTVRHLPSKTVCC